MRIHTIEEDPQSDDEDGVAGGTRLVSENSKNVSYTRITQNRSGTCQYHIHNFLDLRLYPPYPITQYEPKKKMEAMHLHYEYCYC